MVCERVDFERLERSPPPRLGMKLTGIVKRYGSRVALDGVDLAVEPGTVLALLGPNGAGKSTLVSIAAGLLKPDAGTVEVRGKPGLAPQEIGLYPGLTVRENLRAFAELYGVSHRRAERLLEPFVLTDLADRPAGRLSGGEQRRLHTALALVHRPRVALLDEPTAGADTQTRAAILDAVRGVRRRRRRDRLHHPLPARGRVARRRRRAAGGGPDHRHRVGRRAGRRSTPRARSRSPTPTAAPSAGRAPRCTASATT